MTPGNRQASNATHLCSGMRLPHAGTMRTSMVLIVLALAGCKQTVPTATRAPFSDEPALQAAADPGAAPLSPSTVVEELSKRSRIPVSELQELLSDCARTQRSMNICTFRTFVELDLELSAVLGSKRESVTPECRAKIDRTHAAWEVERDRACAEETELDKGGAMRPMLISDCKAEATKARILFVKELDSCR
jgi:uncharacterized protein YecT (DUF1311 family)